MDTNDLTKRIEFLEDGVKDAIDILNHASHFNHESDCRGTARQHLQYVLAGPYQGDDD